MEIPFNFCQLMYKSGLIKDNNIQFKPNIVYGEDADFALRALSYGDEIAISNEPTYIYIQHSQSTINTSKLQRFDFIQILEDLAEFYRNNGYEDFADLVIKNPKGNFRKYEFLLL